MANTETATNHPPTAQSGHLATVQRDAMVRSLHARHSTPSASPGQARNGADDRARARPPKPSAISAVPRAKIPGAPTRTVQGRSATTAGGAFRLQ